MQIPGKIKRHSIMLLVNILNYTKPFLSHCMISAALREAYEVGEKLDELHVAMTKWCSIPDGCRAPTNLPQTKTVRLGTKDFESQ